MRRRLPARPARCGVGTLLLLLAALLAPSGAPFAPHAASADAASVVRVGLYENSPKIYTGEDGRPAGIFVDLIEEIARLEGWSIRYEPGTFAAGLARLASGEIDLMPDVARSAERLARFAFHGVPVLNSWSQVYAAPGARIQSILDLDGKRVAVLEGSVQQDAFARFSAGFGLKVVLIAVPDFREMFARIARGEVDAGVTNRFFGLTHAREFGIEDTPVMFDPSDLFFAAPRGARGYRLAVIDRHLARMKATPDSVYYRSLKRHIAEEVRFRLPAWMQAAAVALGTLLAASLVGGAILKRQVVLRTRELEETNRDMERRIVERTAELAAATVRAQEADRLKSAFLASMSHELRTPLNSIIGFTGILMQRLPGPLNDEQAKQLAMVQTSARHLLMLINDVLDLSKIEAGELRLAPAPFDPRASIGKAVRMVEPLAARKGLAVAVECADLPASLHTDAGRFEQILINLLNNAVKFTDRGGVTVRCAREGESLVVAVADTGIGIPAEEMPRLFRPFHQVDTGLSRKYEGTGLGLSICRRLLDMMGGSIEAASEPGRGSVFTLRLPVPPKGAA